MLVREMLEEMYLLELMRDVLSGISTLHKAGIFTIKPQNWNAIRSVSMRDMGRKYGWSMEELKRNVKLLRPEDIWNPDVEKPKGDQYSFLPVHKFNKKVPVIFMLEIPRVGLLLVDTQQEDYIKNAIKIVA